MSNKIDYSKIDNFTFDYDTKDYPDFSDAFIESCDIDGVPATEEQLDIINEDHQYVYEKLYEHIMG
jgi:hypothetical protein